MLQGRDVVHDVQPASVRRNDEIVVARVNSDIANRHRRHVLPDRHPAAASIERYPQPELRPGVQDVLVLRIFADDMGPSRLRRRHIQVQPRPRLAKVRRLEKICGVVVVLMMIGRHVGGSCIEVRRFEVWNPSVRRQAAHILDDIGPGLSGVPRYLYVAIVGAHPDDVGIDHRGRDCENRAVELGGRVVDDDRSARRLLFALVVGREIRTDGLPRLSVVRRPEQHVAAEVHGLAVGPERDRRVPVIAILVVLHRIADRACRRCDVHDPRALSHDGRE